MRKVTKINFEMEDLADITEELVEISNNFYTKKLCPINNTYRFAIPSAIVNELQLKAGDTCFFCIYSEGVYISFNKYPEEIPKTRIKFRKLAPAGTSVLYLRIPPTIRDLYKIDNLDYIKLIRTKGFAKHEWQIQLLSTECT